MAQDDYYYEIQLTNKQLVFYFMAGATGLILSFLAGVMVGRGVDASGGEVQAARPVQEDRIVSEEPSARPAQQPPAAEDLTYAQRLESEKADDALEKPKPAAGSKTAPSPAARAAATSPKGAATASAASTAPGAESPKPAAPAVKTASPPGARASVSPTPRPTPAQAASKPEAPPAGGSFTIQVGAFKDKASADSVVARLKQKGFAAFVVAPEGAEGGLFNVRVGSYPARADAERVQTKLRDEEKFKPFIVRN